MKINDFRGFKKWPRGAEVPIFEHYNLVYGPNGSGKSTLADLLAEYSKGLSADRGLEIEWSDTNGAATRSISDPADSVWKSFKVFNRDYVGENLDFESADGGSAAALLKLGKAQIDRDKRLAEIDVQLAEINRRELELDASITTAKKANESILRECAKQIAEELHDVDNRYALRSYNASSVRKVVSSDKFRQSGDIAKRLDQCREAAADALDLEPLKIDLANLASRLDDCLSTTVQSEPIQRLVEHPPAATWVEAGIALHHGESICYFCDSDLTPARRNALARHFDESFNAFTRECTALQGVIDGHVAALARLEAEVPKPEKVLVEIQDAFTTAREAVLLAVDKTRDVLEGLRSELLAKRDKPFESVDPANRPTLSAFTSEPLDQQLKLHNDAISKQQEARLKAAQEVEAHRVAVIADGVIERDQLIAGSTKEAGELDEEKKQLTAEREQLASEDLEPHTLGADLSDRVARFLGRSDIVFEPQGENTYRILRNGEPATALSEGERNAIALIHFLVSLDGHDVAPENTILVIDDPVSSLDQGNISGAMSLLWDKCVPEKFAQLVILTHTFEFFRQWSYQLQRQAQQNRIKDFALLEMRPTFRIDGDENIQRHLGMVSWPDDQGLQRRLRSEYHYLFWRVVDAWIDYRTREHSDPVRDVEAASILPNTCRRLLEGFLAFKDPMNAGNLYEQLSDRGPGALTQDQRTRLRHFVDRYSHREDGDASQEWSGPEGAAGLDVVVRFIREVDEKHFNSMCEALNLDPTAALRRLAADVPPSAAGSVQP